MAKKYAADAKRIETRKLDELKQYPEQSKLITDLDEPEFDALCRDMLANGQLYEIEITPDGTVIDGHQRLRAAKELLWPTIRVWVRDDLVDDAAIQTRFIEANLNRRHLSMLVKARCYLRLKKLMQKNGRKAKGNGKGSVRDILAEKFNMSGRNLEKWVRALRSPIGVQEALEAGKVTLTEAGRVADLSKEEKRRITREISQGCDPKGVINRYAPLPACIQDKGVERCVRQLIKAREKGVEELSRAIRDCDVVTLRQAMECMDGLMDHIGQRVASFSLGKGAP